MVGNRTEIGTEDVNGAKFKLYVDEHGTFGAEERDGYGEWITATTLPGLKTKLKELTRRDIQIPATEMTTVGSYYDDDMLAKPVFKDVTIIGKHSTRGHALYRYDATGEAGREQYRSSLYRRLTKAEQEEYMRLRQARKEAETALAKWIKEHKLDLDAELRKVQKAAAEREPKS